MGVATENSQHQKEKSIQEDLSQTWLWIWEEDMFWRWISVSETKQKSSQVWSCFPQFVALLMICTLNHGSEGNMIRSCFFCWHPMVSQCHCGCMMSTRKDPSTSDATLISISQLPFSHCLCKSSQDHEKEEDDKTVDHASHLAIS